MRLRHVLLLLLLLLRLGLLLLLLMMTVGRVDRHVMRSGRRPRDPGSLLLSEDVWVGRKGAGRSGRGAGRARTRISPELRGMAG
jgi:hypothetical protein